MPLPTFVVSLNNRGSRAGMGRGGAERQTQKRGAFLVQFKAEQFIIKNKNIKQGGGLDSAAIRSLKYLNRRTY